MKSLIGILLIIAALVLGYFGYDKMQNSKAGIKIGDLEISATDNSSHTSAYVLLGFGALCLVGGISMVSQGKK
jgi:TRAP-type C4-dicarboxylate transport system permease small subunit